LLTAADTVAALQDLFQAKRQTSGLFLAAAPVAVLVTAGAIAVAALSGLSNTSADGTVPGAIAVGGIIGAVALLSRYTRYTKSNERDIISQFEKKRRLPKWVTRNLAEHQAAKP
jgi:hypothetical protein